MEDNSVGAQLLAQLAERNLSPEMVDSYTGVLVVEGSPRDGWIRLYLNTDFTYWVDFPPDSVVFIRFFDEEQFPLGRVTLWCIDTADVRIGNDVAPESAKRQYLRLVPRSATTIPWEHGGAEQDATCCHTSCGAIDSSALGRC